MLCAIIGDAGAEIQPKTAETRDLFQAVDMVSEHCGKIVKAMKEPYSLVEAYRNHYKNHDFDKKMTDAQRLDLFDYFAGRKNLPSFTFLIPDYDAVMNRQARVKFNALMSADFVEKLGLDTNEYPFAGNCEVTNLDAEFAEDALEIDLQTKIAFGTKQRNLTYKMVKEQGYQWQIDDLVVGGKSLVDEYRQPFSRQISMFGFDALIQNLCNTSNFSKLGCEE